MNKRMAKGINSNVVFTRAQVEDIVLKVTESVSNLNTDDSEVLEVLNTVIRESIESGPANKSNDAEFEECVKKIIEHIDVDRLQRITSTIAEHYRNHTIIELNDILLCADLKIISDALLDLYYITYENEFLDAHDKLEMLNISGVSSKSILIEFIKYCKSVSNSEITLYDLIFDMECKESMLMKQV